MSDVPSDSEDQSEELTEGLTEELTNWQTKERFVKEKVSNMHRFTNDVDIRRMPKETFVTAMADRATLALYADQIKSTNRVKRMFGETSVVSIHSGDKFVRVVSSFMSAIKAPLSYL